MEELLRENLALMDRVATLADEREVWRQTAESAALPGQGCAPCILVHGCVLTQAARGCCVSRVILACAWIQPCSHLLHLLQPCRLMGVDGVSQLQEEHARLSVENEYLRQALGDRGAAALGDMDLSTLPPYVWQLAVLVARCAPASASACGCYLWCHVCCPLSPGGGCSSRGGHVHDEQAALHHRAP